MCMLDTYIVKEIRIRGRDGHMVQAELIYNPYLLETEVRFNGKPPRINSLVEKYQGEKLQTWVNDIPSIFYDEMNGYDFELDFSGTDLDFEELKKSFARAGVGKDLVQLFHKGELKSRHEKSVAIDNLLKWIAENPNRKFDTKAFREKNKDLFESAYSFVVIGGSVTTDKLFEDLDISAENVESIDELRKTDLHSTPVLLYLDRKTAGALQYNLTGLLKRSDITQEQLFFMISPVLGNKAERVIRDLGVREPQIVASQDDPGIYRYLELFPESEYIYDAIKAFHEKAEKLGTVLEEENRQSENTNKDIHEKIKELDDILSRLKAANDLFLNKENLDLPRELSRAKTDFINEINRWKIKKTKITKTEEARTLSYEFESEVFQLFDRFKEAVDHSYAIQCAALMARCEKWFRSAHYREDYKIQGVEPAILSKCMVQRIADELINIKEEQYVMPKEVFFGKLFKGAEETPQKPVLETTYYYEKWRTYATEIVEPVANNMIQEAYANLQVLYEQLSAAYIEHIGHLLKDVSEEKEQVASQLSEDERLLQDDNDWHTTFCDKLRDIERS